MSDSRRRKKKDGLDPEDLAHERTLVRLEERHVFPMGSVDEFRGAVYFLPDDYWGFETVTSSDHPGACVDNVPRDASGLLVQGRGLHSGYARRSISEVVEPTPGNGLTKSTAFEISPTFCPWSRLLLFNPERRIGTLAHEDRQRILDKLLLLFPEVPIQES